MNILFIYTNINTTHEETYSFGLASLIAVTKQEGYIAKVLIISTPCIPLDVLFSFNLDVVAFTSVSSQFGYVKEIAGQIRQLFPKTILVCGGIHTTLFPESILGTSFDVIFRGESEGAFIEFLGKVDKKLPYKDTPNICYVENGKVIINPLNPLIENLDVVPFPDKITYPYIDTVRQYGIAPFMFSRGCPYLCTFCSNHALAKVYGKMHNIPRYRSPESSIQEIEEAIRQFPHIKTIWIMDDTFGINKKWREKFCQKYKERIGIKFDCLLRANVVNEEFIRLLKDSGCYRVTFGIESGNEYIRNTVMNRKMSTDQIETAFALCRKYGLETNANNIIGIPGETEDMIQETIWLNRKINPTTSGVSIFYPYKGTVLGDYCYRNGLVTDDNFAKERQETILNFPENHKRKLEYYRANWSVIIYPYDLVRRAKWLLMKYPPFWNWLRRTKRYFTEIIIKLLSSPPPNHRER